METKSSKLFAAWDINLWDKYRSDLFFRTTCHIILLQIILTAILIGIFWVSLRYLGSGITVEFVSNVEAMLRGGAISSADFASDLQAVTAEHFFPAATIVIAMTLCFGFITTYVALSPTRRSLERKKRFVNNIAHELRTPLAIVRTNTDVALGLPSLPGAVREMLLGNIRELERISQIMNNLLTLNKVMNEEHMQFANTDLAAVVTHACAAAKGIADQKEVALDCRAGRTPPVDGNAVALEQVAFNLIENAITYTKRGGSVRVFTQPAGRYYVDLVVQDTGSGIAKEDLYHIFEPFYRSRRAPRGIGSGLGLTIVNEIIRMHRGKIRLRSKKGEGTTVTISVPVAPEARNRPAPAQEERSAGQARGDELTLDFSKVMLGE
jgi:signal transduction histidine kinase